MNIIPLGNRLVVKLTKKKNVSASGIILSSQEENEQAIGEVVAVGGGQGKEENISELNIKVGDRVIFGKYSGEEIKDDSDSEGVFKILNSKEILAILK